MSNVPMPEPVAVYKQNYGICWTSAGMLAKPADGAEFITTTQAEAYADARVAEAQQWISVKDEMPPDDDTLVLALHAGNEPEVVFGFLLHETLDTWTYTHWMRIPPLSHHQRRNHE